MTMIRTTALLSLALLAACTSEKPAEDKLVTLDGTGGSAPAGAPAGTPAGPAQAGVQATTAEGSRLEPILSSAISTAGLNNGACRFSPAQGALPVLVASKSGGKAIISVAGSEIVVAPAAATAATGGSYSAQGITLAVTASEAGPTGGKASMQVNDADGPTFTYQDGFWACN